ncbi:MAG: isochorismatase family protein [Desulfobacterales bacterium]
MSGKWGGIVVDLQGDFTEVKQGALAVAGTDEAYLESVRAACRRLFERGVALYATQDWHPADHISFFSNHPGKKPFEAVTIEGREQVLWPPHCVQGTANAEILLDPGLWRAVVKKGMDRRFDSYSGFRDDGGAETGLERLLKQDGIGHLLVFGLATDYCVKATALDAVRAGFRVTLVESLCRGVAPETSAAAIAEMKKAGIAVAADLEATLSEAPPARS